MRRMIAATLIVGLVSIGSIGCTKKTETHEREVKITTPGGTTTITNKQEVKKTGDNPP